MIIKPPFQGHLFWQGVAIVPEDPLAASICHNRNGALDHEDAATLR